MQAIENAVRRAECWFAQRYAGRTVYDVRQKTRLMLAVIGLGLTARRVRDGEDPGLFWRRYHTVAQYLKPGESCEGARFSPQTMEVKTMAKARISVTEYQDRIANKVWEVIESDRFREFLMAPDTLLAFRREVLGEPAYSFNNRMTLALYGAQAVAGYRTWQSLGFQVRKGSVGIPIFSPVIVKKKAQERDEDEEDESSEKLIGFSIRYVFDITQVEEMPGDAHIEGRERVKDFFAKHRSRFQFCRELIGGDEHLLDKLTRWVDSQKPVTFEDIPGEGKGYTDYGSITVKAGMSPAQSIKTLLHELAHNRLGHGETQLGREGKEVQAESAAYIASANLGLDTSVYSFDYLASWARDILQQEKGLYYFRTMIHDAIVEGQKMSEEFKAHLDSLVPAVAAPQSLNAVAA